MNRFLHIFIFFLIASFLIPLPAQAAKKKKVGKKKAAFSEQTSASVRPPAILNEMKHWSNPDYT
ncbi:MAG: N-acetylmuramoyl-L-alanine amidase, partial [Deltaproteobacteria bacterium]